MTGNVATIHNSPDTIRDGLNLMKATTGKPATQTELARRCGIAFANTNWEINLRAGPYNRLCAPLILYRVQDSLMRRSAEAIGSSRFTVKLTNLEQITYRCMG